MAKVLQQNTWIDDRKFLKSCVQARAELDNINYHDGRLHVMEKWKRIALRKVFEQPALPLETKKARNDGNCKDHSGSQMACQTQTAMRYKLHIMQIGTRTTCCKNCATRCCTALSLSLSLSLSLARSLSRSLSLALSVSLSVYIICIHTHTVDCTALSNLCAHSREKVTL